MSASQAPQSPNLILRLVTLRISLDPDKGESFTGKLEGPNQNLENAVDLGALREGKDFSSSRKSN